MVTSIHAVRLHSTFNEAEPWLRAEDRFSSSEQDTGELLAPARGAMLGLVLGGLMWVGLIAAFRAVTGL